MMDFRKSQVRRDSEIFGRNKQLQASSSLARRLDDQGGSQITQYFNINNQGFENSENTLRNPKQQSDRSNNPKLQMFSSFPQENTNNENAGLYLNKNYYINPTHLGTSSNKFNLNKSPENVRESRAEQSLQKAFNLNRSTHRIPFKRKQAPIEQKISFGGTPQGYNFYHPSYDEYFPKGHRKFWIEAFEKFYDKRGSLQTMQFPSFQSKDQSKSYQHMTEIQKKYHQSEKENKPSSRERINYLVGRCSGINTVLLVVILIVGVVMLVTK